MLPPPGRRTCLAFGSEILSRPHRSRSFVGAWQDCNAGLPESVSQIVRQDAENRQRAQPKGGRCLKSLERMRAGGVSCRFGHGGPPASLSFVVARHLPYENERMRVSSRSDGG